MMSRLLLILLVGCVVGGCSTSDRTINLADGKIATETSERLAKGTVMAGTATSDGRLAAILIGREKDGGLIVREMDTDRVVYKRTVTEGDLWMPVLFNAAGTVLYCETSRDSESGFGSIDLATGQETFVPAATTLKTDIISPRGQNQDCTLAICGIGVITQDGKLLPVPDRKLSRSDAYFDEWGNIWIRIGRSYTEYCRDGSVRSGLRRPRYLVQDPSKARGSMTLERQEIQFRYKDSGALVTAIWLVHAKAVQRPNGGAWRAALVDAAPDVWDFGFFPSRDAIWVVTQIDLRIVPFTKTSAP